LFSPCLEDNFGSSKRFELYFIAKFKEGFQPLYHETQLLYVKLILILVHIFKVTMAGQEFMMYNHFSYICNVFCNKRCEKIYKKNNYMYD